MAAKLVVVVAALGLSCAVATSALAQGKSAKTQGLQIGVVGGVNISTFAGSDASNVTSRTAFYAGAALTVPLGPTAFLQPEVLYSSEGAKTTVTDSTVGTIQGTFKPTYLEIPILLGLNFGSGAGTRPRIYVGPSVAVNLSCDVDATAVGTTVTSSCSAAGLTIKTIGFGATGGARFHSMPATRSA